MQIRPPEPGELPGTLAPTWARVCIENQQLTGYVCASIFENQAWIHELHYWGQNPHAPAVLIKQAINQIKKWGYSQVLINTYNTRIQEILTKHNFKITQIIMKGEI